MRTVSLEIDDGVHEQAQAAAAEHDMSVTAMGEGFLSQLGGPGIDAAGLKLQEREIQERYHARQRQPDVVAR